MVKTNNCLLCTDVCLPCYVLTFEKVVDTSQTPLLEKRHHNKCVTKILQCIYNKYSQSITVSNVYLAKLHVLLRRTYMSCIHV